MPYLFSAGEDKAVKCWDLEQNRVVRHYHGHLSAVYACALHPTLDVLVTAGRDATLRVRTACAPSSAPPLGVFVCLISLPRPNNASHLLCPLTRPRSSARSGPVPPTACVVLFKGATPNP